MRAVIFSFVGFLLVLCGCASDGIDVRLEVAEGLMITHPDSALVILENIQPESLKGAENKAYYALLRVQASYENNNPVNDTSLIDEALRYYGKVGDDEKYMRSLVFKALWVENTDADEALNLFRMAERAADSMVVVNSDDLMAHKNACMDLVSGVMKEKSIAHKNESARRTNVIAVVALLLSAVLCVLVALLVRASCHNRMLIEHLQNECGASKDALMMKLENETRLKQALCDQIGKIRELIELSHRFSGTPNVFMREFKEKMKITRLSDDFWKDLRFFVDANYNNVITRVSQQHPNLTEDELCIIGLMCCGFSYTEISICMGYSNIFSGNTKRARIAKKMNLTCPLKDYISDMIAG